MSSTSARAVSMAIVIVLSSLLFVIVSASVVDSMPPFFREIVDFLTSCPYRGMSGRPCPLCGGTTAIVALLRGDLETARAANILAVILFPVVALELPLRIYRCIRPRVRPSQEIAVIAVGIVVGGCLAAV